MKCMCHQLLLIQSFSTGPIIPNASSCFCFSVSHKWLRHGCVKQLCVPLLIPESHGRNARLITGIQGVYLVNNMGENSHHSLLLGFCFHFVSYVETDITESTLRVSCRPEWENIYSLISMVTMVSLGTFLWTIYWKFRANFDQKVEVKQKSCCCLKKKRKKRLVLLSPTGCCHLPADQIWSGLRSLCCGPSFISVQ